MKISKKKATKVVANEEIMVDEILDLSDDFVEIEEEPMVEEVPEIPVVEEPSLEDGIVPEITEMLPEPGEFIIDYKPTCDCIQSAIDSLGDYASNGDEKAKEAIANLAVIYFDLC